MRVRQEIDKLWTHLDMDLFHLYNRPTADLECVNLPDYVKEATRSRPDRHPSDAETGRSMATRHQRVVSPTHRKDMGHSFSFFLYMYIHFCKLRISISYDSLK